MNKLNGKIAVVSGSTQGLGAAIANRFAQNGVAGLVISGRNKERGQAVADKITMDTGIRTVFHQGDLAKIADCQALIRCADTIFQRIDILVNAAAITERGDLLNTTPEFFDRMFAINTRAPYFLMQETVKIMIREGIEGSIVNIGSVSATTGQPFISAYCASKGALQTITRNSAYALMRNRIRCNQLNIGWMASDGEDQIQKKFHGASDDWAKQAGSKLPFGRLLDPAEVAKAVAFLASVDSGMMTGSVIHFDQSVLGGCSFAPPSPDKPFTLQ